MGKYLKVTLSNGMRCVFTEDDQIPRPMIFANVFVGSGASADPAGKSGMAHVLEHVVSRKLTENASLFPPALRAAYEKWWIVYPSARTELDYTRFSLYAPTQLYHEVFEFFKNWMQTVPLNEEYTSKCIQEVLNEKWGQLKNNPFSKTYDGLYQTAFTKHPYRWYTVGQPEQIKSIQLQECKEFFKREYRPENLLLYCIFSQKEGEIDLATVVEAAEKTLGSLQAGGSADAATDAEPAQMEARYLGMPESLQPNFVVAFKSLSASNPSHSHLRVLNQLLFGANSQLRAECGADFEMITGVVPVTRHPGLYEILAKPSAEAGSAEGLANRVLEHCTQILSGGLNQERLDAAKKSALAEWHRHWKYIPDRIENFGSYELLGRGSEQWLSLETQLEQTSLEDLEKVAREVLNTERSTVVYSV